MKAKIRLYLQSMHYLSLVVKNISKIFLYIHQEIFRKASTHQFVWCHCGPVNSEPDNHGENGCKGKEKGRCTLG